MNYTFKDISTTKFSINDRELFKTFICYYVDANRIKILNIYDSTQPLIPTTQVSDIDIDGTSYANATLLMNALASILFVREGGASLDTAQIEANRVAIVSLDTDKSDVGHTHDDRYYTETEIDAIIAGIGAGTEIADGEVDGDNLNLKDASDNIIATVDVSALRAQGTIVAYENGVLTLKDENGVTLSTTEIVAKSTFFDKFKYLEGYEDDLNDLTMTDDYAVVKTTGGLYFFVVNDSTGYDFGNSRVLVTANDESYDLGSTDIDDSNFLAWQITVTENPFIIDSFYGFNYWTKEGSSGISTDADNALSLGTDNKPYYKEYENYYLLSKSTGDLEAAITATEALAAAKSKIYKLVIDQDCDLTGVSPKTITMDMPVEVLPGFRFITPIVDRSIIDETNPITGTVADNYIQLQFNGKFKAIEFLKCFEGDGLVWFGKSSVEDIYTAWWGMYAGGSSTDVQNANVKAWQMSINCVVLDKSERATSRPLLPIGDIYVNKPSVAFACSMESHPYLTGKRNNSGVVATVLKLEGPEEIKHGISYGSTTNIFYTAKWGSPLVLQGLRNSSVKKIKWIGSNEYWTEDSLWLPAGFSGSQFVKTVLRPDNFGTYDVNQIGWIESDIKWGQNQPYAAIITDPFGKSRADGGFSTLNLSESTLDLYYGTTAVVHHNSWDVKLTDQYCSAFVSWLCNTLAGQQGDTYQYNNIQLNKQPIGVSTCQDQSRDCKAEHFMAYVDVWAAFESNIHGAQIGVQPEVQTFHAAGSLKYIFFGSSNGRGILKADSVYAESIYAIGKTGFANNKFDADGIGAVGSTAKNAFPAVITNSTIKLSSDMTYTTSEGTCYIHRAPDIENMSIRDTKIGPYGSTDDAYRIWALFRNCIIDGLSTSSSSPRYYPLDAGWFNNYKSSTLRLSSIKAGSYFDVSGEANGPVNTEFSNGPFLTESNSFNKIMFAAKSWNIDQTLYFRRISGTERMTVFPSRGYIEIDNGLDANFAIDDFALNDIIMFAKNPTYSVGVVVAKSTGMVRIANISKPDMDAWEGMMDGSNEVFDLIVTKPLWNLSHAPILATKTGDDKVFTINAYAALKSPASSNKLLPNTAIRMPDGDIYFVLDVTSTTFTIERDYTPALDHKWIAPMFPNYKTTGFSNRNFSSGHSIQSSFYEKGKRYDYYSDGLIATTDYVVCTKEGDFYSAENGSTTAAYKANFLRYSANNDLIDYIDGENTVYPATAPLHIPFNKSGTTAERPDSLGIPDEVIPYGFIYKNTTTTTTQWWDGAAFIDF